MDQEPAARALRDFHAGRYSECLARLNELSALVKHNRRVAFNKAVAEFYASGCENIDIFQKELIQLTGQSWPSIDSEEIKSPNDAPIYYSCAILLYRCDYFGQARKVLEKLLTFRDRLIDGNLSYSIVLLLMEVYICCRAPEKAILLSDQNLNIQNQTPEFKDLLKKLRLRACLMNRKQLLPPTNIQTIDWLILRAHQLYVNGDIPGAVAALGQYRQFVDGQLNSSDPDELWAPLNNNLGVLYSAMKKHNLSVKYMQQALKEHSAYVKKIKDKTKNENSKVDIAKDRPLYVFNLGASLLKANRPEDAFDCLVEAIRHYPNNPRIWLRLAECCVFNYNKLNGRDNVVRKIGSGAHAKLIPGDINKEKYIISGESYAIPTLSLEFAALCLMNAVTLLPYKDPPVELYYDQCIFPVNPSDPMNYRQYCDLRNSALLLYSFVSLRLNDHPTALEHSSALLTRPGSPAHCVLAHLYSAEALISLDRITEATEHLNPTVIHNFASKMNPVSKDIVLFAMWLNTAVCHTIRGDLTIARNILHQINSPRALPLQLYLESCAGNIDNCRVLLRKFQLLSLS